MVIKLVAVFTLVLAAAGSAAGQSGQTKITHGLSLLGDLKYPADFQNVDYVNPDAPKGGLLRLYSLNSFDTFNPYNGKGASATGLGLLFESLMISPADEASAEYGLLAESVEVPDDLSHVIYRLRPEARFQDGSPVTAQDVIESLDMLKTEGSSRFRFYYRNVLRAVDLGGGRIKFEFTGPPNRELPQITGQLPILPRKWWSDRDFTKTTLEPPLGSGPYRIRAFEAGRFIEYERVADWWGAELPINRGRYNFDRIRYDYYRDQTVALEAFKADRYDIRGENISLIWATGYDFPARREGRVKLEEIDHVRPTGMQAFVFNIRKKQFQDPVLRLAMSYAFDFEWSNKNLFYGQYNRTKSYFSNSELAARELPSPEEIGLLESLRGQVPDEVFTSVYEPPATDGSGRIRKSLATALKLLKSNGYKIADRRLVSPLTGKPVEFEILLISPAFERVVGPFIRNLKRLGITAVQRTIDLAQYINRLNSFDYDMIVSTFSQSESPGNEQRNFWSSAAADQQESRNLIGIRNPAVDALIEKIIEASDRKELVTATRALDRVLSWNHYVIPHWHTGFDRVAYWDRFGIPKHPRYGYDVMSWWSDPAGSGN